MRGPKELHRNGCGIFITAALASANLLANVAQADSLTFEARIPNPPAELPVLIRDPAGSAGQFNEPVDSPDYT